MPMTEPVVSASRLHALMADPSLVVVDCRFSLADPEAGRRAYDQGHLPGAVYAHLERDLSGELAPGRTGRHPLPDPGQLAERLGRWGISGDSRVVAYDDAAGAMAARLWFLLRWLGHDAVAVLDGGLPAWTALGYPVTTDQPRPEPRTFVPALRPELVVDATTVDAVRARGDHRLLDARAAARFRGDEEPIDPVAGHIPGAGSLPFSSLLADGRFLPRELLVARLRAALGVVPPERGIVYCGSGVTACHLLVAADQAGLGGLRLYAGSWSEWITDPARPVARGDD